LGQEYTVRDERGKPVRLRFVGLPPGSLFAGELLVSEDNFRRLYPSVRGPRYFLIAVPPGGPVAEIAQALRATLGDLGLEVQTTADLLNAYARVQNTYLSMFLALGGLGMLLGTVGMVTVVLRGALERRGEFAVMLATGWRSAQLVTLLVLENAGLLALGLGLGAACALVAVLPQIWAPIYRPHWAGPVGLLVGMVALGVSACALAARASVRGNLLEALREE
jgi:ABC-type antimicrobial peptide transport system permease subunit